ncbi:Bug family tripartite tricarboxylate transporter substrate binding protein [Bosea minatitlanensis]|jgi:tripartite-type tricarboxylate transporter receptor subunit TctC|uniref:Bug family tripartite tricarboxylate transporter substrate binding protein n=1 Tax=Bosea minatitlanensis TaxID=128782 RepID=A0ABW0F0K2_9HYPH|nr:tripartite tricarboxylate transporter substrate binding protein [Bosea minatitlanensis]
MKHLTLLLAMLAAVIAGPARAQDWPTGPVTLVVPYPAGGGVDTIARILADDLGRRLPQRFIVENKPGAATLIGTSAVKVARPDGQTLGIITDSHAINPGYGRPLPYDSEHDFAFVSGLIRVPLVLIVNTEKVPFRTLAEVIDAAKRDPGSLTFASLGGGSPHQLAFEWLRMKAGIDVRIVPYRGIAPALQDVVGGQVSMMLVGVSVADGFIASGKVRPIAVTSATRLPRLPDLPTVAEQGFPDYEVVTWYGLVAPARTPASTLARLHDEIRRTLAAPEVKARIDETGADIFPGTAADFAAFVKAETSKYRQIIEQTGSKLD